MAAAEPQFDGTHVSLLRRGYHQCPRCHAYLRNIICPFCKRPVQQLPLEWGK